MRQKIKLFVEKYETHISSGMMVGGFILDNFTLQRVDLFWDDVLLIGYLIIALTSIFLANLRDKYSDNKFLVQGHSYFIFAMQFVLGGLFSSFVIFYSRSATIISSWPFLLILLAYLLGNEVYKKHYILLTFQITAFFIALYSFLIFFLPVVMGEMGDSIFLLSGFASLVIIFLFVSLIRVWVKDLVNKSKKGIIWSVCGVFALVNILYFTNIIPPIPLALKEGGVYHSVTKNIDGTYELVGDKQGWLNFIISKRQIVVAPGDPVYVFSSIFAPTKLTTNIYHSWQYYDETKKDWISAGRIRLFIAGGRDGGYRTYSMRQNLQPGLWRVNIETQRGQLVGRIKFEVARSENRQ